ncbi:hypothetical protein C4D60_Mb04t11560 [Musa balbisiana]|uniref:Uncharacterized protein n=1 Tax=Musa balbisiana TaxID=52838 RepID=A0A4V4H9P4_MUSBA|nr:hypothetical protein C4D60_Mb04t11560 [Musa balbisiana]
MEQNSRLGHGGYISRMFASAGVSKRGPGGHRGRRDKSPWTLKGEKRKKREGLKEGRFRYYKKEDDEKELWEYLDGERREERLARKRKGA